jgi:hypothetical protein
MLPIQVICETIDPGTDDGIDADYRVYVARDSKIVYRNAPSAFPFDSKGLYGTLGHHCKLI